MGRFIDVNALVKNVYNTSHSDRNYSDRFEDLSTGDQNRIIFSFVEELFAYNVKLFLGTQPSQIRHIVVNGQANGTRRAFFVFYIRFIKEEFSKTLNFEKAITITSKILSQFESEYYTWIEQIEMEDPLDIARLKRLFKNNKKSNESIRALQSTQNRLRNEGYHYYLAISIKVYEENPSILLELGISLYNSRSERISTRHYIVEENSHLYNKTHVQDYRDCFHFGQSKTVSLRKCFSVLLNAIQLKDIALVCFGSYVHLRLLQNLEFDEYDKYEGYFHNKIINFINKMEVFDMMKMHREYHRRPRFSKLRKVADDLHVDIEEIQIGNAGNDAHIVMQIFQNFFGV